MEALVMLGSKGITLMEIIVVLVIMGLAAAIAIPNYAIPTEKARASTVENNLMAIYTAQRNYINNSGNYCLDAANSAPSACSSDTTCGDSLTQINCSLSLNIQDDGTYTYSCTATGGVANTPGCTATRTSLTSAPNTIVLTLNSPINLTGTTPPNANPACTLPNAWCP